MKLLVLGGSTFVGRHFVHEALHHMRSRSSTGRAGRSCSPRPNSSWATEIADVTALADTVADTLAWLEASGAFQHRAGLTLERERALLSAWLERQRK